MDKQWIKILFFSLILSVGIFTHLYHLGQPAEVIFDEVHFGKFFSSYLKHEYFFDIHPPLGKLIFAAVGYISKFQPIFDFNKIGEPYPDYSFIWMRLAAAIFGIILPIIFFLILRSLSVSFLPSLLGMAMITFENSLLVQSRIMLMDIFLLVFGLMGFLFCVKRKYFWAGLFLGLSFSVKWTGLGFLALVLVYLFFKSGKEIYFYIKKSLLIICVAMIIYASLFIVHFYFIKQSIFINSDFYSKENIIYKGLALGRDIIKLNKEMYKANQGIKDSHPYSSKWYQWPLAYKSIFYWSKESRGIHLMPNRVVWLLALFGVVFTLFEFSGKLIKKIFKKGVGDFNNEGNGKTVKLSLFAGYFINWLPFIFIGRVMFLYHYFPALLISLTLFIFSFDKIIEFFPKKFGYAAILAIFISVLAGFIYYLPQTYGF